MTKTEINKKALMAVAAELNEKRNAGINVNSKVTVEALTKSILDFTENGTALTKLNKESRQTIAALLEMQAPADPAPAKESKAPAKEKGDKAPKAKPEAKKAESKLPEDLTSREAMNVAAHDMNEVMGLEPGVDTSLPDDQFHEAFAKAANMAKPADAFSEYTWSVLRALGMGPQTAEEPAKAPAKAKPAPKGKAAKEADPAPAKESKAPAKEKGDKAPKAKPEAKKAESKAKAPKAKSSARTVTTGVLEFLDGKKGKPFTITELYEQMQKEFPEKNKNSLLNTVRAYVPHKVRDQYGYTVTKDGDNWTAKKAK